MPRTMISDVYVVSFHCLRSPRDPSSTQTRCTKLAQPHADSFYRVSLLPSPPFLFPPPTHSLSRCRARLALAAVLRLSPLLPPNLSPARVRTRRRLRRNRAPRWEPFWRHVDGTRVTAHPYPNPTSYTTVRNVAARLNTANTAGILFQDASRTREVVCSPDRVLQRQCKRW